MVEVVDESEVVAAACSPRTTIAASDEVGSALVVAAGFGAEAAEF